MEKWGPRDHGRPLTLEAFRAGDYQEGYRYELIDGKLYVSPWPDVAEDWVTQWLFGELYEFKERHRVLKHVTCGARVFVPGRPQVTVPAPDLAAYRRFPLHRRIRDIGWEDVSPALVVEVLDAGDLDKDLVRNLALYLEVPSIKEYWIFDAREDAYEPRMTVYRRRGRVWRRPIEVGPSGCYTTHLLPGFQLVVNTQT
jgi:Uma2 family endonuclease